MCLLTKIFTDDSDGGEMDVLSVDLGNGLNFEESESAECITNNTSFSDYDYLNDGGMYDEGEGEWDEEDELFEEELTDLDTDDDDMPMNEQDSEDNLQSQSSNRQPLHTCVQREMTQNAFSDAFLEVRGAGLGVPETVNEHCCANTIGHGVDGKTEYELIAEVERRRLRDFGPHRLPLEDQLEEGRLGEENCSTVRSGQDNCGSDAPQETSVQVRVPSKPGTFRGKVGDLNDSSPAKGGATAVRTRGEVSAQSEGLGVSTPRGTAQPSPALTPSLFPRCLPPTIHFPMSYENCEYSVCACVCNI